MPNNKYIFTGILVFDTALHIGGGTINETNTDSPIVKTPDGLPYIPGSSIKGAFRSLVERLAAGIPGIKTCQLNSDYTECLSTKEDWSIKDRTESQIEAELEAGLCDTCKVFGSPHRAAKVFFQDLNIKEWAEMTQVRDGVVIDRDSGTAVSNFKYDYEVLPVDSEFYFEIVAEDVNETDIGLLSIGLNELLSGGFQLGGKKTRGLGNCKLQNFEIYMSDWENSEQFKKYLLGQTIEEKYSKLSNEQAKQFLNQKINNLFANQGE